MAGCRGDAPVGQHHGSGPRRCGRARARPHGRRRSARARPLSAATSRRPPPEFRSLRVHSVQRRGPRLVRITLAGGELAGFPTPDPAASVRVLLPEPEGLVLPAWNGNEFLLPDGRRPILRTLTPRRYDVDSNQLDVEVVVHGEGAAARWATTVEPGAPAAISGPARGYRLDPATPEFLIAGDETALPAMSQLLEVIPVSAGVSMHIEIAQEAGELDVPTHPGLTLRWHLLHVGSRPGDELVAAVKAAGIGDGTRVWVAGEAAAVQRVRKMLFEERGLERARGSVRGYWKLNSPATLEPD